MGFFELGGSLVNVIHLQANFSTVGCKEGSRCNTTVSLAVCEFEKEGKQLAASMLRPNCVTSYS